MNSRNVIQGIVFVVTCTLLVIVIWIKFILPDSIARTTSSDAESTISQGIQHTLTNAAQQEPPTIQELFNQVPTPPIPEQSLPAESITTSNTVSTTTSTPQ